MSLEVKLQLYLKSKNFGASYLFQVTMLSMGKNFNIKFVVFF